ncbi:LysR substrate-binding domain-containing protein [Providencia sp. SP181]|uniref:LysR family transcriptional regulator n=1 Tax=Providencia sp. SP181 TaxID=3136277 RepID=UPI003D2685BD
MDMRDIEIFSAVVSMGSFSRASRRLGISAMTTTRVIASLEQELGCRLFHRTTRAGSLTPEGEVLLPYVRSMLDMWESARTAVIPEPGTASGTLRLTCSNVFGRAIMVPLLHELQKIHPHVSIELICTDDHLDLVENGIDVAIRFTHPKDSTLVGRKLSENPRHLYSSPSYAEEFGHPTRLQELNSHRGIRALSMKHWPFMVGDELKQIGVPGNFACNSAEGVKAACTQGIGLALLSQWDVQKAVEAGALVRVTLEDATPQNLPIWALFPTAKCVPARVRVLIDLLERTLA